MDQFNKYADMRNAGADAIAIYTAAKADGMNPIASIRLLRELFQLSLVEAKEIIITVDKPGMSLMEYQDRLKSDLAQTLENEVPTDDIPD